MRAVGVGGGWRVVRASVCRDSDTKTRFVLIHMFLTKQRMLKRWVVDTGAYYFPARVSSLLHPFGCRRGILMAL